MTNIYDCHLNYTLATLCYLTFFHSYRTFFPTYVLHKFDACDDLIKGKKKYMTQRLVWDFSLTCGNRWEIKLFYTMLSIISSFIFILGTIVKKPKGAITFLQGNCIYIHVDVYMHKAVFYYHRVTRRGDKTLILFTSNLGFMSSLP